MQTFTKNITVTKNDLDELNHVNNVRYIDWVNTVAKAHWHKNASKNTLNNYFWVLLSHTIDYKKAAILGDEILLKTFVTHAKGVTSTRVVEIYNNKTQVHLAQSTTKWCFMDAKTLKPTRITDEVSNLFC